MLPTNPSKLVADLRVPNNTTIKILAIDVVDQPPQVNLGDATNSASPAFNTIGISMQPETNVPGAGIDGAGGSYSALALGNTVAWNSQTFDIGPAAATSPDNVIAASGSPPILLPQGHYTSVQFLATSAGGYPTSGIFYVDYTDSSTDAFTVGLSDWHAGYTGPGTTAAMRSIAATGTYYNTQTGTSNVKNPTRSTATMLPTNLKSKLVADMPGAEQQHHQDPQWPST